MPPLLAAAPVLIVLAGVVLACGIPVLLAASLVVASPQTAPSAVARGEIPAALLARYQQAPACHGLPWQVVAAIGHVETRHGTHRGTHLDPVTGEVTPRIVGIALDGTASAAVGVPPAGSPWHTDPVWDHATGPMQFLTATWASWGVDASGDGVASPHNAYDAIATAGRYLCHGQPRLHGPDAIPAAVHRYNPSTSYVAAVLAKATGYGMAEGGDPVTSLPPPADLAAAGPMIHGTAAPVIAYALAQLGDPYVWGAAGPDAFDCSGLVLAAYAQLGIHLPHQSGLQARYGRAIDWHREPIQPGDLLFLPGGAPVHDLGHVGIALDADRWIHAPRSGDAVKIAPLPHDRLQAVRRLVTG